jgi:hypothetical protein
MSTNLTFQNQLFQLTELFLAHVILDDEDNASQHTVHVQNKDFQVYHPFSTPVILPQHPPGPGKHP